MSTTFDVIPVIEQGLDGLQDTHEVQLALTPNAQRILVQAFCRAVLRAKGRDVPLYPKMLAAGVPGSEVDERQVASLDNVQVWLGTSWTTLALSPDEATALGNALLEAGEAPPICADCNRVIDSDMSGNVCARCTETPRGRRAS